ncbi:MAG TPA: AI-2E family transporter [Gemmatimonadales bacterium]|nr:AI-2E family transporter [Gemmatimonadales bacterium]
MPFLDTKQQRAAFLILLLGVGLAMALWPFLTGLIGAPVLYVVFAPLHRWLSARMNPRLAAGLVVALSVVLIVGPGASLIGLVASQAQDMANGVIQSPLLARLRELRIGPYDIGAQLEAVSARIVSLLGEVLLSFVGTATRLALQLTIAFFGLFFLLIAPGSTWNSLLPFIPFSTKNAEALRTRFRDVTTSTLIGTGLTAFLQGSFVYIGFLVTGLPNALFWGVITMALSILPVVGSGLVWVPGVAALALEHRYGWALALTLWGLVVVGNVDNLVRPIVYRRWAQIHPFVTLIGAFAGLRWFGLLGLLIGPLAISYFFELIRMYRQEYLEGRQVPP